jgi:hypothetical protein
MSSSKKSDPPPPTSPAPVVFPLEEAEEAKSKVRKRKRGRFDTILSGQLNNRQNPGLLQSVGGFSDVFGGK